MVEISKVVISPKISHRLFNLNACLWALFPLNGMFQLVLPVNYIRCSQDQLQSGPLNVFLRFTIDNNGFQWFSHILGAMVNDGFD